MIDGIATLATGSPNSHYKAHTRARHGKCCASGKSHVKHVCTTRAATLNCAPKANTSQPNVPTNWSDSIKPISAQKTSVSALGLSCFVCKHNILYIFNQKFVRPSALGFEPTLHCVCTMLRVWASGKVCASGKS